LDWHPLNCTFHQFQMNFLFTLHHLNEPLLAM
jgi:hypothetical protein